MNGIVDTTVLWLTARQLFARRRLIVAAIVSAVPGIIALIYRAGTGATAPDADRAQFLIELYRDLLIGALLPLVAVVLGTAAFGGEIDDGTIIYLLVKPLRRWRIVLSKYLVAVASTVVVMVPAIVLPWLVVGVNTVGVIVPAAFAAAIGIGTLLYGALFVMLGLTTKRGLLAGLLYVLVVEFVMSHLVDGIKSLSIREFMNTITGQLASSTPGMTPGTVTSATVWTMGSIVVVGSLAFSIRWLRRYELAERL